MPLLRLCVHGIVLTYDNKFCHLIISVSYYDILQSLGVHQTDSKSFSPMICQLGRGVVIYGLALSKMTLHPIDQLGVGPFNQLSEAWWHLHLTH